MKVSPNRPYTPTPADSVSGGLPIYAFNYASETRADSTVEINMDFYVAKAGLPKGAAAKAAASSRAAESEGAGIELVEIGKTGVDVGIGSLIDYAKDKGVKVGPLGSIYALASALSNVGTAVDLSRQNNEWLDELDDLEDCAANPTNPIAKSDPDYSKNTVAKIQAARSELKEVNAVRYLNNMTETGSGIIPATAVLSIGLKQGFVWSEKTLNDYSENTIMREARLAVDSCQEEGLEGNVDVVWECTETGGTDVIHTVIHKQSKVTWVFSEMEQKYIGNGTFAFDYTRTVRSCTDKKSAAGSLESSGRLVIIDDPGAQNVLGFRYLATGQLETEVTATYCTGTGGKEPYTITWLREAKGAPGINGDYSGETTKPSCVGTSASGTEVIKWNFSVPPK